MRTGDARSDVAATMVPTMHIDKLTAFVAVADERSFSVAAEELDVPEEDLRAAVEEFERQLGHRLFAQTTGTVRLTPEGAAALAPTRIALSALEAVTEAVSSIGLGREVVRLGVVVGAVVPSLPHVLAQFAREFPDVRLEITAASATALESRVADGSLDLAYVVHIGTSARFHFSFTDPLVVVGGPGGETISIVDLAERPVIAVDAAIGVREALERAASLAGARIDVIAHVATPELALELAGEHLGRAVVARTLAPAGSPRVLDADGAPMELRIGLIAHPEHRSTAAERLLEHLCDAVALVYGGALAN